MTDVPELPDFLDRKKNPVPSFAARTSCRVCRGTGVVIGKHGVVFDCLDCRRAAEKASNPAVPELKEMKMSNAETHTPTVKQKSAPKAKVAKGKTKPKAKAEPKTGAPTPKGKTALIVKALLKENGASRNEILKLTGWPAINLKGVGADLAARYGYTFKSEKAAGENTVYMLIKK